MKTIRKFLGVCVVMMLLGITTSELSAQSRGRDDNGNRGRGNGNGQPSRDRGNTNPGRGQGRDVQVDRGYNKNDRDRGGDDRKWNNDRDGVPKQHDRDVVPKRYDRDVIPKQYDRNQRTTWENRSYRNHDYRFGNRRYITYNYHRYGRPQWAPRYGYRYNTRYIYYQDYNVYYDCHRDLFIIWTGRNWVISSRVPAFMNRIEFGRTTVRGVEYWDDDFDYYLSRRQPTYLSIEFDF